VSIPLLDALALAIFAYEGSIPGQRAYRNCNPGNLRSSAAAIGMDEKGYCIFGSFVAGFNALLADLTAKVSGRNTHGLGPDSTLEDLFRVYAPSADNNDPERYATFVAVRLAQSYDVVLSEKETTFAQIYKLIGQEVPGGVAAT
jgi:hypothetical protein